MSQYFTAIIIFEKCGIMFCFSIRLEHSARRRSVVTKLIFSDKTAWARLVCDRMWQI